MMCQGMSAASGGGGGRDEEEGCGILCRLGLEIGRGGVVVGWKRQEMSVLRSTGDAESRCLVREVEQRVG